ncbi:general substrate transporter [Piedraia hortae CBS 480.64]|uniref:General substrate transporter n=1 Tax=Piedraia hortae CBS 480.64 TaxID=1314780 RepID=A0A6A7BU09_9PEZI|nr:general substrate transporter [Piedraia hortae CBS 480.64]
MALLASLLIATIGPLLFGYHLSELNAPQHVISCRSNKDSGDCIPMSAFQFGLVTSIFTLGGLIGALSAGPLICRSGRLWGMKYSAFFATLGPALEAMAPSIAVMASGRLISGLGAGAATVIVPIYIAEIAPVGRKGFYGALTQIGVNVGIFLAQLLGLFCSRGGLWRVILGVGGLISLMQGGALMILGTESPRWLTDNGKLEDAKSALQRIREPSADIEAEIRAWKNCSDEEQPLLEEPPEPPKTSTALDVLRPPYLRTLIIVVTIMAAQQLTGINSIIMYGVGLLSDILAASSGLLNLGVAALNILLTSASAPLIERIGRKKCLLISIFGTGLSSTLLAVGMTRYISILSAIAVLVFVASFALGLGPVPFLLASELVEPEAVSAVQSWALAANWLTTFLVAQSFPILHSELGGNVYFFFAASAGVFGAFIWFSL